MERTLADWAEDLASGKASAREGVEACLARIAAQDPSLHAFVAVFEAQARAAAARADAAAGAGMRLGPLHGIPFAVKDLADIAGHAPSFGSRCYARGMAARTAPAIARLEAAGAILVGVTHMVEFAIGSWGTNSAMGTPRNPCDPAVHRVAGGSSSGSAVAVAAGLVPFAIGSDTGGSIRIPASLCGTVGFKPSSGVIPLDGIAQLSATFDTLGPLARSVADVAHVTAVLADRAPTGLAPALPENLGYVPLASLDPIDGEIAASYADLLARLRRRGHRLQAVHLPCSLAEYQRRNGRIVAHEVFGRLGALAQDATLPLDPHVRQRVLAGAAVPESEYRALLETRTADVADMRRHLADRPILLLPSTPIQARRIDDVDETAIPLSRFTRLANYLDLVAISVPMGGLSLPAGLQILGPAGSDDVVLAAAAALEPELQVAVEVLV